MTDPLERLLKNESQVAIARLEDSVVKAIYEADAGVVLHGGTAIWRCYGGSRFSSDIDMYLTDAQVRKFNNELTWSISKYQMKHDPPSHDGRRIKVFNDYAKTIIEAMRPLPGLKPVSALYEAANGTRFTVRTLSVDNFIKEKMHTYEKRFYARDLFDVYQLVINYDILSGTKKQVLNFVEGVNRPKDENVLKDIVYVGPAPTFDEMINGIRGRLK